MSVHRIHRKSGVRYAVHWRDESGRQRKKTFQLSRDAHAFDAKLTLAKRAGELEDLDRGRETLEEFTERWWQLYGERRLAESTKRYYRSALKKRILPELGHMELRRITTETLSSLQFNLALRGDGDETVRKTLAVLQSLLARAVEWGLIKVNPAQAVRKVRPPRQRAIRPLSPAEVEEIRGRLKPGDSALVAVMAYAGLRPAEALALHWDDVWENNLLVHRAISFGREKETKTNQARTVRLFTPLRQDLREWAMACGRRTGLVFPRRDGRPWTDFDYRNWRKRVFQEAAPGVRPYDLRHSFVSLLLHEGRSPLEVAEQAGHSPTMTLNTYGHIIEELRDEDRRSAEQLIVAARDGAAQEGAEGVAAQRVLRAR